MQFIGGVSLAIYRDRYGDFGLLLSLLGHEIIGRHRLVAGLADLEVLHLGAETRSGEKQDRGENGNRPLGVHLASMGFKDAMEFHSETHLIRKIGKWKVIIA